MSAVALRFYVPSRPPYCRMLQHTAFWMGVQYFPAKVDNFQRVLVMVSKSDAKSGRSFHELINKEPNSQF